MTVTPEPPEDPQGTNRDPDGDAPTPAGPPPPGGPPGDGSPGARHLSDDDVDALFGGIVAGLEPSMRWGLRRPDAAPGPSAPDADRPGAAPGPSTPGAERPEAAPGAFDPGTDRPGGGPVPEPPGPPDADPTGHPRDGVAGPAADPTAARERAQRADREALEREITRRERERRAHERAQRREFRRVEREAELAAFEAHEAEVKAAHDADQEHFDPPEPPPVPRPRGRTLAALLCLAAGLVLLVRPGLLALAPDAALVLSVLLLFAGAGLLVWGLRSRHDRGDGPDDGAVV